MSWKESSGELVVDIFRAFDDQIKQNVELLYDMITSQFYIIAVLITGFYILFVSLMLMNGKIAEARKEFTASIFLVIFMVPFVFDSSLYMETFVKPFTNTIFRLAGFIASLGESDDLLSPMRKLQEIFDTYRAYADYLDDQGKALSPLFTMKLWAAIILLGVCLLGSGITFFLMILYNLFMVYIMFIVGGPCLFFISFSKTRHIFWGWLRGLMTFALSIVLAALIISVALFAIQGSVEELYETKAVGIFTDAYFAAVLIAILVWYALKKTSYIVAMLVGGAENASHGITAVAGGVVGGIAGAGFASTQRAAGAGLSGIGSIASGVASAATGFAGSASALYRQIRG